MSRSQIAALTGSVAAVAFAAFWPIHFAVDKEFCDRLLDAGHLPLFGSLALVFHVTLPVQRPGSVAHSVRSAALSILVAATVELVQPLVGRTESWLELRNGIFGALLGATGLALRHARSRMTTGLAWVASSLALSAVALAPAWDEWQGIRWRHANFPLLGDFESEVELHLWRPQGGSGHSPTIIQLSAEQTKCGQHSLRIQTGAGDWAGVSYCAGDKDWSAFKLLAFDVCNSGEPFTLSLRVDDNGDCSKFGSRYDNGFPLTNGWNHLAIPLRELERGPRDRKLNLHAIRRLALFTGANEPARTFFLDHVRLE
jgi:hypothetical protein